MGTSFVLEGRRQHKRTGVNKLIAWNIHSYGECEKLMI